MKNVKKFAVGLVMTGSLILTGCSIGMPELSDEDVATLMEATSPEPAPTVTVTAEPVVVPPVTEIVKETPQSCIDALGYAEEAIMISADNMDTFSTTIDYIMAGDIDGVNSQTARLDANTDKIEAITGPYKTAAASCRASK